MGLSSTPALPVRSASSWHGARFSSVRGTFSLIGLELAEPRHFVPGVGRFVAGLREAFSVGGDEVMTLERPCQLVANELRERRMLQLPLDRGVGRSSGSDARSTVDPGTFLLGERPIDTSFSARQR